MFIAASIRRHLPTVVRSCRRSESQDSSQNLYQSWMVSLLDARWNLSTAQIGTEGVFTPTCRRSCSKRGAKLLYSSFPAFNLIQNVLPSLGFDSKPTAPFILSAAFFTIAKPIPVPGYLYSG